MPATRGLSLKRSGERSGASVMAALPCLEGVPHHDRRERTLTSGSIKPKGLPVIEADGEQKTMSKRGHSRRELSRPFHIGARRYGEARLAEFFGERLSGRAIFHKNGERLLPAAWL